MKNNTFSATVYTVAGTDTTILEEVSPNDAIEQYLCPDMRPPVQTLVIQVKTDDGKLISISITQNKIFGRIE